jgi:hypothetical protein
MYEEAIGAQIAPTRAFPAAGKYQSVVFSAVMDAQLDLGRVRDCGDWFPFIH